MSMICVSEIVTWKRVRPAMPIIKGGCFACEAYLDILKLKPLCHASPIQYPVASRYSTDGMQLLVLASLAFAFAHSLPEVALSRKSELNNGATFRTVHERMQKRTIDTNVFDVMTWGGGEVYCLNSTCKRHSETRLC